MKRTITALGLVTLAASASIAFAQHTKDSKKPAAAAPAQQHDMQLPPGMTEADMMACMEAATPGEQHAHLAEAIGVWSGKAKMWMGPDMPPTNTEMTSTVRSVMDGRFTSCEITGDMPGMGPFNGYGIYGFDNVSQQFQSTWIDNCGTGMMNGTGELSSDGKTMTWNYTYNCPITKKPTKLREIERITGENTRVMEMYGTDPKSGKEFKMMEIALTRKAGAAPVTRAN